MQLFYSTVVNDGLITLSEQESSHCTKVLRMNRGDEINCTDGKGHFYKGIIQLAHDKKTIIEIKDTTVIEASPYQLHLFVALTKNAERLEWMLEKCVELGLTSFTPIITHRTERKNIRIDRLEAIALSAMKQSLKAWLPTIHPLTKFNQAIHSVQHGSKFIAHCADDELKTLLNLTNPESIANIFIGPEGDFTLDEVEMASNNGFNPIGLGPSRLRTETAGLSVCNWFYWHHIKAS
jgi:16S rRNA (uracil1498-N3)-methyltransferase